MIYERFANQQSGLFFGSRNASIIHVIKFNYSKVWDKKLVIIIFNIVGL